MLCDAIYMISAQAFSISDLQTKETWSHWDVTVFLETRRKWLPVFWTYAHWNQVDFFWIEDIPWCTVCWLDCNLYDQELLQNINVSFASSSFDNIPLYSNPSVLSTVTNSAIVFPSWNHSIRFKESGDWHAFIFYDSFISRQLSLKFFCVRRVAGVLSTLFFFVMS